MGTDTADVLQKIVLPKSDSHKGQNGRLLIIGGSHLFHAASLWSLMVASRIVDLVHYSSVDENNRIVHELKKEFQNGIVVPRSEIEEYIMEDDCVLIGPGMVRAEGAQVPSKKYQAASLNEVLAIADEGVLTGALTNYLLKKYPQKQWVIDAGALQMLDLTNIPPHAILTPHHQEFELLVDRAVLLHEKKSNALIDDPELFAKQYNCIVLLKGEKDIASDGKKTQVIEGGNAGMTKGGTGDVLAGLIAALACKSDPWSAAVAGSVINKKAGDELYQSVGPFFNASDLANQIPKTLKNFLISKS